MPRRRGIVGPLILIAIGILFLLANLGYLSKSFWLTAIQFWPLILILAGLELVVGRSWWGQLAVMVVGLLALGGVIWLTMNPGALRLGGTTTTTVAESGEGVRSSKLALNASVGEIKLDALPQNAVNWIQGTIAYPSAMQLEHTYQVTDGSADMKLETMGGSVIVGNAAQRWNLSVVPGLPLQLTVTTGIGSSDLDLNALNAQSVTVNGGVGGINIVMPSHGGAVNANLDGAVGGVTVLIPQNVPARIRTRTGIGGANVNLTRFPLIGPNLYQSAGYETAANKIDLTVSAGIGGITIP